MDWSIQDIARLAGTTSRTLRHYDTVGLLRPTRIGDNGYRYYDERALVRLQRILMLRDLGLGIPAIADVLAGQQDDARALHTHLDWLQQERTRVDRQIASVESTIKDMEGGEQLMAEKMFDGFDHTQYKEEVEERWGKKAYADGDNWWRSKSEAQTLAKRQADWLAGIPGTPGNGTGAPTKDYFTGLADMYVADERFAANYGGVENATFVRDAMRVYAELHLQ